MSERRAVALIAAVWLLSTVIWLRPGVTKPDGAAYVSWLPSTWIDHDLLLFRSWSRFGMLKGGIVQSEGLTANGHIANHWSAGSAVVWYPAFLLGDAMRTARFPRDGISLPYNVAAVAASAFCGLIALLAGYFAARRFFARDAALIATITTWFGTPLLWYSEREALMAHAAGAAMCALVVLASLRDDGSSRAMFVAGLAAGLAFSIRPQSATFLAVPLILCGWRRWAFAAAGFVAGALPQIVVLRVLYGNPFAVKQAWHSFERFWAWEPLLSWYHGAIAWAPLLLVGIAGFAFLERRLRAAAMAMFVAQWLLNATADRFFWAGSSFGQRRFDNCTIFFLLGAAALFARLPRWASIAVAAAASLWTMALFFAASVLDLNRYYLPSELLEAAVRAPKTIGVLISVPAGYKAIVLAVAFAVFVLYAALAVVVSKWPALAGAALCIAASVWFAVCGANDAAHMRAWEGVIAANRAVEPYNGAIHDYDANVVAEEWYLRKSGRVSAPAPAFPPRP